LRGKVTLTPSKGSPYNGNALSLLGSAPQPHLALFPPGNPANEGLVRIIGSSDVHNWSKFSESDFPQGNSHSHM
jgi:hypothetical protein